MTRRNRSGLPEHCSWNYDRHGKRRVRFRKGGFSTYLSGTPWSEDFMRQYAAALEGMKAQANNIGAKRTVPGSVNAIVAAYLDCSDLNPHRPSKRRHRRQSAPTATSWRISREPMATSRFIRY